MITKNDSCSCRNSFGCSCRGLSAQEYSLLQSPLPQALSHKELVQTWDDYQNTIGKLLVRMGSESAKLDSLARMVLVHNLGGVRARIALLPTLGRSARHLVERYGMNELLYRLAGEFCLMELSAAAGYRTFCFPQLVKGLMKTGKMQDRSVSRMIDTFDFLKTMVLYPLEDPRVVAQLERTNKLHSKYKVAGNINPQARDLFKYIALNMFYIGPSTRPDLTPAERHAICGLTCLVASQMGHNIIGTVVELENFITEYEAREMFNADDKSELRQNAVAIARASRVALDEIPTISSSRIHGLVPFKVKRILAIT